MEDLESILLHVIVQLIVIIGAARVGAWLMAKLGQPQVVGEITAGLLLGPSLLGRLDPATFRFIFVAETSVILRVLAEIGLILLMFLIGLEFEFSHLRRIGKTALAVALAGILLPFGLGLALAYWMQPLVAPDISRLGFSLIVGVALSITAIPVLGRIMVEFNIQRTRLGVLTITAAAVDDVLGWVLLAAVSAIVRGHFDVWVVLRMFAATLLFIALCRWIVRPIVCRWIRRVLAANDGQLPLAALSMVLLLVLVCAAATSVIGIFAIFGPFILGAVLWDQHQFREAILLRLRDFVYAFLLPIFFTYTGLRTNIGLLNGAMLWGLCLLLLFTATVGKMLGCGLAAWLGGLNWRESGCVAVMMNTRALMGLIAINVGRDLEILPDSVFSMLVIMALVTTFMTSPLLRRLLRATDLEVTPPSPKPRHHIGAASA